MNAIVMVGCASAICYGIRGWWFPMWVTLIVSSVVAGAALIKETKES